MIALSASCASSGADGVSPALRVRVVRYGLALLAVVGIFTYLMLETVGERSRMVSALGAVVFVLLCWLCSRHPGKVRPSEYKITEAEDGDVVRCESVTISHEVDCETILPLGIYSGLLFIILN